MQRREVIETFRVEPTQIDGREVDSIFAFEGSYSTMYPATALAATVSGDARYNCPGPLRPGKFRFCALMTT